jgi:hypothetical protein
MQRWANGFVAGWKARKAREELMRVARIERLRKAGERAGMRLDEQTEERPPFDLAALAGEFELDADWVADDSRAS